MGQRGGEQKKKQQHKKKWDHIYMKKRFLLPFEFFQAIREVIL